MGGVRRAQVRHAEAACCGEAEGRYPRASRDRSGGRQAGSPDGSGGTIDDLLDVVDSKYGLVIMASKRARQINAYYAQLSEGLLEYVGPLVETRVQEKPLSIALREISEGLVSAEEAES